MKAIICFACMLTLFACSSNPKNNDAVEPEKDTTQYYQLKQFVDSEITYLRHTPYFIYKLTVTGEKKDSIGIDTTEFIKLAYQFLENDINDPKIKKQYRESVFEDKSTNSYVLNYSTTNPELHTKSIDVMLNNETQQLKRIDIRKSFTWNDTAFNERLAWLPNRKFQIIQIASKGNAEITKQTYVVWNDKN